jgi:acetyl-CoA carboxylase biotin carboxyl carrier protein
MDIAEIEQLVEIVRNSAISELLVETDSPQKAKVRLRKPLAGIDTVAKTSPRKPSSTLIEPERVVPQPNIPEMVITAPMVGIFHNVGTIIAVGDTVKSGSPVGTIESMKLMNDIISEYDGVIAEVLIEDGMPVEYGQTLYRIECS